ncbi:recombinase family protein [Geminocystis sp. NIES-3709]|uniref:recombinase family protein n=1 Tax=Geminocystis sp. NIES-3709 TaxID=1617448 RepID=UPI0005FC3C6D|nr:recombinase family protein [Geminocystis sp. NIES-3709]BAQ67088.1 DNA-invertase [Geminocystis sp. NIES-3709]
MTIYGYARVSTDDQTLQPQLDRLIDYGISTDRIYSDYAVSGSTHSRPNLDRLLEILQPSDTLVVVKLDRLGRSLKHLIETVELLKENCINFVSLTEGMDTNSSTGRLLFNIFGAIAEFERDLIIERTNAGITSAKKRGVHCGRPDKLNSEQQQLLVDLRQQGKTVREVCHLLNISKATYYRCLKS